MWILAGISVERSPQLLHSGIGIEKVVGCLLEADQSNLNPTDNVGVGVLGNASGGGSLPG